MVRRTGSPSDDAPTTYLARTEPVRPVRRGPLRIVLTWAAFGLVAAAVVTGTATWAATLRAPDPGPALAAAFPLPAPIPTVAAPTIPAVATGPASAPPTAAAVTAAAPVARRSTAPAPARRKAPVVTVPTTTPAPPPVVPPAPDPVPSTVPTPPPPDQKLPDGKCRAVGGVLPVDDPDCPPAGVGPGDQPPG